MTGFSGLRTGNGQGFAPVGWCWVVLSWACLFACKNATTEQPVAGEAPLAQKWRLELPASSHIYPIRWKDKFLFSYHADGHQCFTTCSASRGKIIKQWCLELKTDQPLYYNLLPGAQLDQLFLPAPGGLLLLSPDEGHCRLKSFGFEAGENSIEEKNGIIYRVYYAAQNRKSFITAFNSETDSLHILAALPAPDSTSIFVKTPFLYTDKAGQDILVTGYTHYNPKNHYTHNGIRSIAADDGRILSDTELDGDNYTASGISHNPVVAGPFSYWMVHNKLICYDHENGYIRWKRSLPAPLVTSRPLMAKTLLLCAAEDGNLYALSLASGALLWSAPVSGSPSRVFQAGNYLFLVGGADGVLYGIRAGDGAVILKKRSGQHNISAGLFYQRTLFADDEYLLLFDGKSWECYSYILPALRVTPH